MSIDEIASTLNVRAETICLLARQYRDEFDVSERIMTSLQSITKGAGEVELFKTVETAAQQSWDDDFITRDEFDLLAAATMRGSDGKATEDDMEQVYRWAHHIRVGRILLECVMSEQLEPFINEKGDVAFRMVRIQEEGKS